MEQPTVLHRYTALNDNSRTHHWGIGPVDFAAGADMIQVARTLEHHLNVQSNLCAALESVADSLPTDVRSDDCLALGRSIYPIIARSHQFEQDVLFPILNEWSRTRPALAATLDRLHGEHWEDESFAEEVQHELVAFVADRTPQSADKLGYMLRGFFCGLRRHLAFDREFILPLLQAAEEQ